MAAVGGKERYIELSREFHLCKREPLHEESKQRSRKTYGLCNVALSAGNNNNADSRSLI